MQRKIEQSIEYVQNSVLDIEYKGDLEDYISVNLGCLQNGLINFYQPHTVKNIVNQVHLLPKATTR